VIRGLTVATRAHVRRRQRWGRHRSRSPHVCIEE
jgi:hypothetical protein